MKKLTIEKQIQKVLIDEIDLFEQENNFNFPDSYKEFLLENNGGVQNETTYWDEITELELHVSKFYSLKHDNFPLEDIVKEVHSEGVLPLNCFPFASTGGGGDYIFLMQGDELGNIYVFNYDGSDPLKVCESFEQFINSLEES